MNNVRSAVLAELRGVPRNTAALRAARKRFSREIAGISRTELLRLAGDLIEAPVPRFAAYELVLNHRASIESITEAEVKRLGKGIAQWWDIDSFACFIAGPAWRLGRLRDGVIRGWARSEDWCWRRAALVSTVPLNSRARGGDGDTKRTLAICRMLVEDRNDLVVKAMSWALRELGKRDADGVRGFVAEHRDGLAARVVREVENKLDTGVKNPRRRHKS